MKRIVVILLIAAAFIALMLAPAPESTRAISMIPTPPTMPTWLPTTGPTTTVVFLSSLSAHWER